MDQDFDSLGLAAFLTVCSTKNFTRAAQLLHITQPALSQRIRRFEDSLGTTLIYRSQPNLSLTSAGQEVFSYGQRKKALLDDLRLKLKTRTAGSSLSGMLRLGAFSSVLRSVIMPTLANFLREHRNISAEFFSREVIELPEMLMRGAIDIAILNYELADDKIKCVHLFSESYVMIESNRFNVPDIFLDHDPHDQTTMEFLRSMGLPTHNIRRSYFDDIYGIVDGVRLGMGKAVVPRHLLHDVKDVRIVDEARSLSCPVIAHVFAQDYEGLFHQRVVDEIARNCRDVMACPK